MGKVELAIAAGAVAVVAGRLRRGGKGASSAAPGSPSLRDEVLFRSMFPELQPYFHPRMLVRYVASRRGSRPPEEGRDWSPPPGFEGVAVAEIRFAGARERVRLLDKARAALAEFAYEETADGGVLRVGRGKLTVDLSDRASPRVRYWHPDREFKWNNGRWTFKTRVAEQPFESRDSSLSFSSDTDSSRVLAPAAAAFVGAGGTFDGGGASQGWDAAPAADAAGAVDGGASSSDSASTTAY